jgi:hypothetical protein
MDDEMGYLLKPHGHYGFFMSTGKNGSCFGQWTILLKWMKWGTYFDLGVPLF